MRCGLLGEKLGHSYSKAIHERLGGYSYELIECPRAELDAFMKGGSFDAINVTIPYKKAVIPYCAALSPIAERIGRCGLLGEKLGHSYSKAIHNARGHVSEHRRKPR